MQHQWRSSAPKSVGGGGHKLFPEKKGHSGVKVQGDLLKMIGIMFNLY